MPANVPSPRRGRQARRPLDGPITPVEALRALGAARAALLESRTDHPEARFSYVAFNPRLELELWKDYALETFTGHAARRRNGHPWDVLSAWLDNFQFQGPKDPPFQGGWVGFLSHEASGWILDVPPPPAALPARPDLPFGHFRLYRDVVVFDRARGTIELIANDFGDELIPADARLTEAQRALSRPPPAAPAARTRGKPTSTLDAATFQHRVDEIRSLVHAGDCFQVNLTSSTAFEWATPPAPENLVSLYDEYAGSNPGPWGGYYPSPHVTLLSASPELLADHRDGRVRLRPIAGTRPRGADRAADEALALQLRTDAKEVAEHAMLVDLARNDAAAVCEPGSVRVANLAGVERYRHVMHLVSEVEGVARRVLSTPELLTSVFPGGTVTGAPKRRATRRIAELEGGPRGPYTGTLGYVSVTGPSQWNLLIRTLTATPTHLVAHAGCGIVEASKAKAEWEELEAKARAQVEAAQDAATPAPPGLGSVDAGPPWHPPQAASGPPARVLLVDCEDSFVRNLADYAARLGARVTVASVHERADRSWKSPPTHMILSPGPGRPEDFPQLRRHLDLAQLHGTPTLGVCLGHQAIAHLAGAEIHRAPETVHGRASAVRLTPEGATDPVLGPWRGGSAGRYHSLVATRLPPALVPLAVLDDGTCMAFRQNGRPWWGVQFHPESLLTDDGLAILAAFFSIEGSAPKAAVVEAALG